MGIRTSTQESGWGHNSLHSKACEVDIVIPEEKTMAPQDWVPCSGSQLVSGRAAWPHVPALKQGVWDRERRLVVGEGGTEGGVLLQPGWPEKASPRSRDLNEDVRRSGTDAQAEGLPSAQTRR